MLSLHQDKRSTFEETDSALVLERLEWEISDDKIWPNEPMKRESGYRLNTQLGDHNTLRCIEDKNILDERSWSAQSSSDRHTWKQLIHGMEEGNPFGSERILLKKKLEEVISID